MVVLGIGGWYALSQGDKPYLSNSQNTTSPNSNTQKNESVSETQSFSEDDFSFEYPKSWVKAEADEGAAFQSADYALDELAGQYERGSALKVSAGYKLIVQTLPTDAPNKTLAELTVHIVEQEKILGGGTHKQIIVDGNQALQVNDKNTDQSLYVIVFKGQKRVHIQLDAIDDTAAETSALFDKILASFVIK